MVTNEFDLSARLPQPPSFTLRYNPEIAYQVPPFFGFEHQSTKWIMTLITSKTGTRRLYEIGREYPHIYNTYYQVPDNPNYLMKLKEHKNERPAYNNKAILYLTPIGLAIYLKNDTALKVMLRTRNSNGERVAQANMPCFAQKVFKTGNTKSSNDITNTSPALLAVRREFFEGIETLMHSDYSPQRPFSIIYRKPFDERLTFYRDLVDYCVELLRSRPGMCIASLMQVITTVPVKTRYDIFMFEIEGLNTPKEEWVSVFRRISRLGLNNNYYNCESGMSLIAALEVIQTCGFFLGNLSQVQERQMEYGYADAEAEGMGGKVCQKIGGDRLLHEPEGKRNQMMDHDRAVIIGILISWFHNMFSHQRLNQMNRLQLLIAKIMMDTFTVEVFFDHTDEELAETFTRWSEQSLTKAVPVSTVTWLRMYVQNVIQNNVLLHNTFFTLYGNEPSQLISTTTQRLSSNKNTLSPTISPDSQELCVNVLTTNNAAVGPTPTLMQRNKFGHLTCSKSSSLDKIRGRDGSLPSSVSAVDMNYSTSGKGQMEPKCISIAVTDASSLHLAGSIESTDKLRLKQSKNAQFQNALAQPSGTNSATTPPVDQRGSSQHNHSIQQQRRPRMSSRTRRMMAVEAHRRISPSTDRNSVTKSVGIIPRNASRSSVRLHRDGSGSKISFEQNQSMRRHSSLYSSQPPSASSSFLDIPSTLNVSEPDGYAPLRASSQQDQDGTFHFRQVSVKPHISRLESHSLFSPSQKHFTVGRTPPFPKHHTPN